MGGTGKTLSTAKTVSDKIIIQELEDKWNKMNKLFLNLNLQNIKLLSAFFIITGLAWAYAIFRNFVKSPPKPFKLITYNQINKPSLFAGTFLLIAMFLFLSLLYSIALRSINYKNNVCVPAGAYDYDIMPCNASTSREIAGFQNATLYANGLAIYDIMEQTMALLPKFVYEIYSILFRLLESLYNFV